MNLSQSDIGHMIPAIIQHWVVMFPTVAVWGIGILIALARWRRHPKVSLLVVLSCGLSLLTSLVVPIVQQLVFALHQPNHSSLTAVLMGVSLVWTCLGAISMGLMLFAVFTGRPENEPSQQFER